MSQFEFALLLSFVAGLTTVLGSLIAFFAKKTNTKFLCYALSFSAGSMLSISLSHLLPSTVEALKKNYSSTESFLYTSFVFLFGGFFIYLVGKVLFKNDDLHKGFPHKTMPDLHMRSSKISKLSKLSILAVCIHNLPEGMATFLSALDGGTIGYAVALAIALHNIPEGITVSVPVFYSTGSKSKAIFVSLLAALAEPVGALLGYFVIGAFIPAALSSLTLSFAAGIMVFIALDELIPTSREYGGSKEVILGLLLGMGFISLAELLH